MGGRESRADARRAAVAAAAAAVAAAAVLVGTVGRSLLGGDGAFASAPLPGGCGCSACPAAGVARSVNGVGVAARELEPVTPEGLPRISSTDTDAGRSFCTAVTGRKGVAGLAGGGCSTASSSTTPRRGEGGQGAPARVRAQG